MGYRPLAKHEVVKHVAAIHVSNKLSLLERKVSNVLLRNAWDSLVDQETHSIKIQDLADAVGFDSNDIGLVKDAIRTLRGVEIQWNILGTDKKNVWGVSGILASAVIDDNTGMCEYCYPVHLRELLRNPNIFARLNLFIQREFDSKYSLALWEYAAGQIALAGENPTEVITPWLTIDALHELLGSTNPSYEEFKIFKRAILNPAISEINRISDLEITNTEQQREKRRVTALRFSVNQKEAYQLPLGLTIPKILDEQEQSVLPHAANEEKALLLTRLIERGIEEKVARGLVRGYGVDRISENLEWAERQIESGRQIERPGGFITSAIRRDFVAPERVKRKKVQAVKQKEKTKQEQEAFIEKFKGDFWLRKVDMVAHRIAALSTHDREEFERSMVDANVFRTPARWEEYRREGITDKREHTALRGLFYGFAMSRLLTEDERDIVAYARSQGADDAMIRELLTHAR